MFWLMDTGFDRGIEDTPFVWEFFMYLLGWISCILLVEIHLGLSYFRI